MRQGQVAIGHPVDVSSGTVYATYQDVRVAGRIDLTWERRYSTSLASSPATPLGRAWTTRYFATLTRDGSTFELRSPEGGIEFLPDVENIVDRGGVLQSLGSFQELSRRGAHYVLTRWNPDADEVERFVFSESNRGKCLLASIEDTTGHGLDLERDPSGRLVAICQRLEGRRLVLDYNQQNRIASLTLVSHSAQEHCLARYEYGPGDTLDAAFDALGNTDRYSYDVASRLVREQLKGGGTFSFKYDSAGRCVETSGLKGFDKKAFRYLPSIRVTEVTNSTGVTRWFQWLPSGQVVEERGPVGSVNKTEYDAHGRIEAQIDANGAVTRYQYDEGGNRVATIDALGHVTTQRFNSAHRPVAFNDASGSVWTREYDAHGQLVATQDPLGNRWTFTYDERGQLVGIVNPAGITRHRVFSPAGNLVEVSDWKGNRIKYVRDEFGRIVERVDPLGARTRISYNLLGKPVEVQFPNGSLVRCEYDQAMRLVAITDGEGRTTTYRYAPDGRVTEKRDALDSITRYRWGTEPNHLQEVINHRGETYQLTYDPAERVIRERGFDGRDIAFEYDLAGYCVARTDGKEQRVEFRRDALGRLIEHILPSGASQFTYDALGNLIRAKNADCDVLYERDVLGRILREFQGDVSLTRTFDSFGNVVSLRTSTGHIQAQEFDENGMLSRIIVNDGASAELQRDSRGREIRRVLPGQLLLSQQYDPVGQLIGQRLVRDTNGSVADQSTRSTANVERALVGRRYEYDRTNSLVSMVDDYWGTTAYTYDKAERLVETTRTLGTSERFTYDANRNIIKATALGRESNIVPEYGDGDLLLQWGDTTFTYDTARRRTATTRRRAGGVDWSYTWTAEGRLKSVTNPSGTTWTYAYDPFGRRIRKDGPDGATTFVWDGDVILQRRQEGGSTTTWCSDPHSFKPLFQLENQNVYSVIHDHLGTPRELVDRWGDVRWAVSLTSWGQIDEYRARDLNCPIRFQGQWHDEESGLHYNRFRYYDPAVGRFISADPTRLRGGLNLFAYGKNPINWIDPFGLADFACDDPDIKPLKEKLEQGVDPAQIVPNDFVIVRGGQTDVPASGTLISGSTGATAQQAATGVPHGSIRQTTAGEIRAQGGTVTYVPEPSASGNMNYRHVDIVEGGSASSFPPQASPSPAPKPTRIT
jgi:RHS repeat-associated protein